MDFTLARDWPYAVGAGAYVVVTVGGAAGVWRSRRNLRRRLSALALRTAPDQRGTSDASKRLQSGGTERLLAAVEQGVDRAIETAHDSSAAVARLAGALDGVPWAVVVCDEDGRAVARNVAAEALRSEPEMEALLERVLASDVGADTGTERTFELVGPPRRTIRMRTEVIDDGRRVVGVMVMAEDRTEDLRREQAEKELVAAAGEQLRAPMATLASLGEMVARELEGSAGTAARTSQRLVDRLRQESDHAEQVLEELLALARADSQPAGVDSMTLDELVTAAAGAVSGLARRRNVTISVETGPSGSAPVRGDRRQLVAAVAQLIDNAVRWSSPGQPVTVRTQTDGELRITVTDRGPGVPEEERDRIFERFHRIERRGSAAYPGVGLGLPIVQQVARNHGGSVSLDTTDDGGSAFTLHLPRPAAVEETACRIGSRAS